MSSNNHGRSIQNQPERSKNSKKNKHRKGPRPNRHQAEETLAGSTSASAPGVPADIVGAEKTSGSKTGGESLVAESTASVTVPQSIDTKLPVVRETSDSGAIPEAEPNPPAKTKPPTSPASSKKSVKPRIIDDGPNQVEKPVEPTLGAYFGVEAVRLQLFLRSVKDAKVRRFGADDISTVQALIKANDEDGSRLWQLVTSGTSVEAVSTWVWPFVQDRINDIVGARVDLLEQAPSRILRDVVISLSAALNGDDKEKAKRAENDLRLSIAWLNHKRNIEATEIAEQVRHIYADSADETDRRVRKAMAIGSRVELQAAVGALCLAEDQIQRAKQDRDFERRERFDLKGALDALKEQSSKHVETIRKLEADKVELEKMLEAEMVRADSDRRHNAHTATQIQADVSTSLQRVKGLVQEAAEAVQIAMKRADEGSLRGLQAAERRIRSAVDAITEIGK